MSLNVKETSVNPRKRPKQARSVAMVGAIVEAAARILERGGLDGFNTNAVAAAAGVSPGSLYQYFPNKQSLLAAVIEREISELADQLEQAVGEDTGPVALDALLRAMIQHQMRRPKLRRILSIENPFPFTILQAGEPSERVRNLLIGVIKPLCRTSEDCDETAGDITAMVTGMVIAESLTTPEFSETMLQRVGFAVHGYLSRRFAQACR